MTFYWALDKTHLYMDGIKHAFPYKMNCESFVREEINF